MARATSSFPVPLSPQINTLLLLSATLQMTSSTFCMGSLCPMIRGRRLAGDLPLQQRVFGGEAAPLQRIADNELNLIDMEGLAQIVVGAQFHGFHRGSVDANAVIRSTTVSGEALTA